MTSARRVGLRRTGMLSGRSDKEGERQKVWRKVKAAVRTRSGGRCEVVLRGMEADEVSPFHFMLETWKLEEHYFVSRWRCTRDARDAHHVVKRSQGRKDAPENVLDVCRACHGWFDEAPQSKTGKLMAEPSASPDVAPRTWVTRDSKWERRAHA